MQKVLRWCKANNDRRRKPDRNGGTDNSARIKPDIALIVSVTV